MKRISTLTGILIIIATAVVLFGGAFAYQRYAISKSQLPISNENLNMQNSNSETADWETYKNDQYGFEFQYPNKLFKKVSEYPISGKADCWASPETYPYSGLSVFEGDGVNAKIMNMTINVICKKLEPEDKSKLQAVKIGNKNGYRFSSVITTTNSGTDVYRVLLGDNTLQIVFPVEFTNTDFKLIDQILSTFTFKK